MKYCLFIASAFAAQTAWEGGPTYDITYDGSNLKFDVTVPANMWWGISFKDSMKDVD